jgi:hypothetical protein
MQAQLLSPDPGAVLSLGALRSLLNRRSNVGTLTGSRFLITCCLLYQLDTFQLSIYKEVKASLGGEYCNTLPSVP